jgi:hypothetical protein
MGALRRAHKPIIAALSGAGSLFRDDVTPGLVGRERGRDVSG